MPSHGLVSFHSIGFYKVFFPVLLLVSVRFFHIAYFFSYLTVSADLLLKMIYLNPKMEYNTTFIGNVKK